MTGGDLPAIAGGEDSPAKEAVTDEIWWGTLEELLLAYAVRRHGAARWDSVAMEVRSRVPSLNLLTPEGCEERFRLLQRRYAGAVASCEITVETAAEEDETEPVPWLEELRRLRVAELRLQVKRSDDSIKSLELKVKRLKEERERASETGGGGDRSDPEVDGGRRTVGSPEGRISGGSCKESNSTDLKREEEEVRRPGHEVPAPDPEQEPGNEPVTAGDENSEADQVQVATAGTESAGESKESSDVQSSVSLSKRRRGGRRSRAMTRPVPDADVASTVKKEDDSMSRSESLVSVMDSIRSSVCGAVFELRRESQENQRYRKLIRRHVDLQTLRAKLDPRISYSPAELFRDLLLLCANASLFFPKSSSEFSAAAELRSLVTKEMVPFFPSSSSKPSSKDDTSSAPSLPLTAAVKIKGEGSNSSSLVKKVCSLSAPMVACRKRSSIAVKAIKEKEEKPVVSREVEEKEEEEEEDREKLKDEEDDKVLIKSVKMKKKERDGPSSLPSTKGFRTNKSRGSSGLAKSSNPSGNAKSPVQSTDNKPEATAASKTEKKGSNNNSGSAKNNSGGRTKKRNSSDLLSKVKQRIAADSSKSPPSSSGGKAAEQNKGAKGDGRKDGGGAATRRATAAAAAAAEENASSKRIGRPPKRAAAVPAKRWRGMQKHQHQESADGDEL